MRWVRMGMVVVVALAAACSGSGLTVGPDGGGGDLAGGGSGPLAPVAPLAPTDAQRMYQGGQSAFRTATGTCTGRVAAGMGDNAFCFAAADDSVRCAGTIGGVDYGHTFSTVPGQTGARQILVSMTANSAAGNSICILKRDGTASCMGANWNGPFGDGSSGATTSYVSWGGRSDLVALGTGTWDQMCALTTSGTVLCAGYNFGATPTAQPGTHTSFWVDTFGRVNTDDPTVWRPGESRTECWVIATGLVCQPMGPMGMGGTFGPTDGTVVNGSRAGDPMMGNTCWLTADASVHCTNGPRFAVGKVLHLATNMYTDSLCAIYVDGSVWCIGSNSAGKLGTGGTDPLAVETQVAPPGSALVRCE